MNKRLISLLTLLLLPYFLFASEFKQHLQNGGDDLKFIQTQEDMKRLGFFCAMFDMAQKRESPSGEIPKTLHLIWLGPKPFPSSSIANVKSWIDHHPGWRFKFWTDLGQSAPDDRMDVRVFDKFPLAEMTDLYFHCDNFGERSQILRYAILISEGGVYVDHDTYCWRAIDSLQENYDFFCGMEPLGKTILSSSVNPSPHVLSSTAQHPILKAAKNWLIEGWDRLEAQYTGSDPSSVYNRVQHRGFRALSVGIKDAYARSGRKDVVFPPNYFSHLSSKTALYATHQHLGSWHGRETASSLKKEGILSKFKVELDRTYWSCIALIVLNVLFGVLLFMKRRKA